MDTRIYCKAGNTELNYEEAQYIFNNNLYIVNYSGVWHLEYSEAQKKHHAHQDVKIKGLSLRGRFHTMSAKDTNSLLKFAGCPIEVY